jgi:hypothetical protein
MVSTQSEYFHVFLVTFYGSLTLHRRNAQIGTIWATARFGGAISTEGSGNSPSPSSFAYTAGFDLATADEVSIQDAVYNDDW